jgi:hypothetical protein
MEWEGVDSGARILVVEEASPLSAAERVSGIRTKVAIGIDNAWGFCVFSSHEYGRM